MLVHFGVRKAIRSVTGTGSDIKRPKRKVEVRPSSQLTFMVVTIPKSVITALENEPKELCDLCCNNIRVRG